MAKKTISIKLLQTATTSLTQHTPQLPEIGYLRLNQIIGDDEHPAILPIGKTSFYAGIKAGKYPKPVKLGLRTSAWRVEDIRALVESTGANA